MTRKAFFYAAWLLAFGVGILAMLRWGARYQRADAFTSAPVSSQHDSGIDLHRPEFPGQETTGWASLRSNLKHPLGILFLQLIVIIAVARWVGTLFQKLGQPSVIGEMT